MIKFDLSVTAAMKKYFLDKLVNVSSAPRR